jgi:hypothetical protein
MNRDYVTEMRQVIDQEATGEYVSSVVAGQIVEKLTQTDPELLIGWMQAQAVTLVHQMINDRDRSRRTQARTAGPRSVFAGAAKAAEQGQPAQLYGLLATHYAVNDDDLRKPLAAMTSADLTFVSAGYQKRASDAAMEAAFFNALARKVGKGTVADHFTNEQLTAMRDSLRG